MNSRSAASTDTGVSVLRLHNNDYGSLPVDRESLWLAVMARDKRCDGQFVFAVSTTGIYCRPSCPARRPRRDHVRFFRSAQEAERASYRPCRRCHPELRVPVASQTTMVVQICRYITSHLDSTLCLSDLSQQFHVSPYYLQRSFKRIIGLSPHQYVAACRIDLFRQRLRSDEDVTTALYTAGYRSSSRIYTDTQALLGMTPTLYRQYGRGVAIHYICVPCSYTRVLLGIANDVLVAVKVGGSTDTLIASLVLEYPEAEISVADGEWRNAREKVRTVVEKYRHLAAGTVPACVQQRVLQWIIWRSFTR